jgi:hypothetical protein
MTRRRSLEFARIGRPSPERPTLAPWAEYGDPFFERNLFEIGAMRVYPGREDGWRRTA